MKNQFWLVFLILFLGSGTGSFAQIFDWKADLETVDSSGFYNIFLSPELTSKLTHDFADIRIYNSDNEEIPYLIKTDKKITKRGRAKDFIVLENKHKLRKKYTRVLIHNPDGEEVTNIALTIKNVDFEKWIKISGSNDEKNWFVIQPNSPYQSAHTTAETSEIHIVDIPITEYQYYELLLFDYNNTPIEVFDVKYYNIDIQNESYTEIPSPTITQNDTIEPGKSIVTIQFDTPQYIDKMVFNIDGPLFYLRRAEMEKIDTVSEKKMKLEMYDQMEQELYLRSQQENAIHLSNYKAQTIELIIENKDNPPVTVESVDAYQLNNYLIAYLRHNRNYFMRFGNEYIEQPLYDLRYFRDSIPDTIPVVKVAKIYQPQKGDTTNRVFNINPVYLWIIVGIVTVLLILLSVRMFKEIMQNRE